MRLALGWGRAGWWALVAGALLRIMFVVHHPRVSGDALVYGDLAHNLLRHGVFGLTEETVRPTLIRLPGYPLFLAACFAVFGDGRYLPVLWVQAGVDLVTCVLVAGLAGRLWGRRAGLAALWLAALCPFTANYAAVAITETLSLFCVAAAFAGLERWTSAIGRGEDRRALAWAVAVGCALAGAVLLRPDQGLLAVAVLASMLLFVWRRRAGLPVAVSAFRSASLSAALLALPLLLWGVRNWRVFHVVQPLAPRYATDPGELISYGFQRWYRTWAIDFGSSLDTYWTYDGAPLRLGDLPKRAFDGQAQQEETARVYRAYNEVQSATPEIDAAFATLAAERVRAHPFRYYAVLPTARELNMWLRPRTELMKLPVAWWRFGEHPGGSAVAMGYALWNAAYLVAAMAGLRQWWRANWNGERVLAWAMLGFVALRCALLLTIDNSEPRYTLECFPVLFLLAGRALGSRRRAAAISSEDRHDGSIA